MADQTFSKGIPSASPPPQPQPKPKANCWLWGCLILIILGVLAAIFSAVVIFIIRKTDQASRQEAVEQKILEATEKATNEKANEKVEKEIKKEVKQEKLGSNKFSVEEKITLKNDGPGDVSKMTVRVALIQNQEPYQKILYEEITPKGYQIVFDKEKNKFAEFEFQNLSPAKDLEIKTSYQVEADKIRNYLGDCQGETISGYRSPETYIESNNPKIIDLSEQIIQGKNNDCEKAEAIYNYLGDNFTYSGYVPEDEGALKALETKQGDCTSFADLFLALARASSLPSRFVEGVTYMAEETDPTQLKHDWAEVYLPSLGWVPVDPTWGRFPERRKDYFAHADGDHLVLTQGRNLEILEEKHYFLYRYWWVGEATAVSQKSYWQINPFSETIE